MNIYLVRHGESTSDVKQKYDGEYDDHLTEQGKKEAGIIAEKLAGKGIQLIFSSARIRAKETAEIVQAALKCDVRTMEALNEQNIYGAYPELSTDQPEEEYRRLGELMSHRDTIVPGAETYQQISERVTRCFKSILDTPYDTVAIMTHGGPIRCIIRDILKKGELKDMTNGAIIHLKNDESGLRIENMDGVALKNEMYKKRLT